MSKLKGVNEILAKMIENWPTLYSSRLTTLNRVFTSTRDWSKGFPQDLDTIESRDDTLDKPLDETLDSYDSKYAANRTVLRLRAERARAEFVRSHAAMIAAAESGEFADFRSAPSISIYEVNHIPLDKLTPEWRDALVEYCNAVTRFSSENLRRRREIQGHSAESVNNDLIRLENAKEAARECLMRLGQGKDEQNEARRQMIAQLQAEAAKLGFKLEKIDAEAL